MDLTTNYLGMKLRTPLVVSAAQPLTEDFDNIKRMEDAGASGVVLHSLFEEQLKSERYELHRHLTDHSDTFAEAQSFFPEPSDFAVGPEAYLNHIRKAKQSVGIPIIASLNGSTAGGWTDYAKQIEQAGADALELNIYYIPASVEVSSQEVEQNYVDILHSVRESIKIPIALKLSPYFSKSLIFHAKSPSSSNESSQIITACHS